MPTEKILLVESEPRILEMLVDAFVRRFNSNITCVSTGADALEVEMFEPHSIVVIDTASAGMGTADLAIRLTELSDRPVILMGAEPSVEDAIAAMRCGVADYFIKPFEVGDLLQSMRKAMDAHREAQARRLRHTRMRDLVRHVIHDRRALNRRVELICKDLVGAHRRLARRVLEQESVA